MPAQATLENRTTGAPRQTTLQLRPVLYLYGRAQEALDFYKQALGGDYQILMRNPSSSGEHQVEEQLLNKIAYAIFDAPGVAFSASDGRAARSIDPEEGNISLALSVQGEADGERIFRALADGGKACVDWSDAPWGGKFGVLTDRFSTEWVVAAS
jgi:PhnB protein